jgi:hypothetical protein
MFLSRAIFWTVLLSNASLCLQAQNKVNWQRVYTGEDSIIEINVSSAILEADHILRVDFRTIFSKPENIAGSPGAKYKSRLETIKFKLNENRYRLCEMTSFDSKGLRLNTYTATTVDWRVVKQGGVMERLLNSARTLPPFGSWKIIAYKFADGSPTDTTEINLEKLVGMEVRLQAERAEVGRQVCSSLAYEDHRFSKDELKRSLGVRLESVGIDADYADITKLKCEADGWTPAQSLLIRSKEGKMLMLWKGVLLVLKREREWTGDILPPLKRVKP